MSDSPVPSARARRLLRWYPRAWRERYGEEFADHLDQEFCDRPTDIRRTVNVAYKGLLARSGDLALSDSWVAPEQRDRAAVGTSFVLVIFVAVLALNFWSRAMGLWTARRYHPIPVSLTTGVLTVVEGLILTATASAVVTVVVEVLKEVRRRRGRALLWPSLIASGTGFFLLYCVRWVPRELYAYAHGLHGRPGIGWSQPGPAIAALGQTAWGMTSDWIAPWNLPGGDPTSYKVETWLFPFALLLFGLAIATLVRRVGLPARVRRCCTIWVTLTGTLTGVFLIAFVMWLTFGGTSGDQVFAPEGTRAGDIYLVSLLIVTVLIVRTRWLARSRSRNSVRVPSGC